MCGKVTNFNFTKLCQVCYFCISFIIFILFVVTLVETSFLTTFFGLYFHNLIFSHMPGFETWTAAVRVYEADDMQFATLHLCLLFYCFETD